MQTTLGRLMAVLLLTVSAAAYAQNNRSAVSLQGDDANACTVPAPCRTFAAAIAVTNSGGEIIALDSGGYGPFTIDRAVTVQPVPGAYAGIAPAAFLNGITISAGTADAVVLRGLNLSGLGAALSGISVNTAKSVHVENSSINGFTSAGIQFFVTVNSNLYVNNTSVRNNGFGIVVDPISSVLAQAAIEKCRLEQNVEGLLVGDHGKATVHDTVAAGNTVRGMRASQLSAELNIENCVIANNATGLHVNSGAILRVSNTMITNNAIGVLNVPTAPGTLLTRQNNTLAGNTTDQTGASSPLSAW